jgi:hypothetical protein
MRTQSHRWSAVRIFLRCRDTGGSVFGCVAIIFYPYCVVPTPYPRWCDDDIRQAVIRRHFLKALVKLAWNEKLQPAATCSSVIAPLASKAFAFSRRGPLTKRRAVFPIVPRTALEKWNRLRAATEARSATLISSACAERALKVDGPFSAVDGVNVARVIGATKQ